MHTPSCYRGSQIALHWLIFILFAIALITIEWRGFVPKDEQALRTILRSIHVSAGLLALVLAFLRLGIRLTAGVPAILGDAAWQRASAHLLHWALYIIMFALPISGVIFAQAGGREVAFFGLVLPQLIGQNPELRSVVKEFHEFIGNAVYWLVGIHVLASLWHHFVLKDGTLLRIRPGYRPKN